MKRIQLKAAAYSLLAVFVLVVAACAPAATPTPTATPTPPPVVATPTPTPGVATPTPPPQYGGIIFWNIGSLNTDFDCHRYQGSNCMAPAGMVFNSLVRFSADTESYMPEFIEGDLAERWEVGQDGTVFTFYLRKGVKFHDGKPFTAKDVKHSLEKIQDPKRSGIAPEFNFIDRVEIVDDSTVKVYLKFPSGAFLSLLAQGLVNIQPEHLKDVDYRSREFAVGTGPFKVKSITPGISWDFVRNPDYFRKGRPYLDEVRYVELGTAATNAFIGRKLDGIGLYGITKPDFDAIERLAPEAKVVWHPQGMPVWRGLFFNFSREGPWQDVRVRKAMVMTFDFPGAAMAASEGLEKLAYYKSGYFLGSPPAGQGLPWSEYEKAWWLDRPWEERIKEAKRLLAEAGYPNGFKVEVMSGSTPSGKGPSLVAKDLWMKYLNIDVTVAIPEAAVATARRAKRDYDITHQGVVATIGEPQQFIAVIFMPGGSLNYSVYDHPKVGELYQQLQREMDPKRRTDIVHQVEKLLIQDIPAIPGYKAGKAVVMWPYLKGWKMHPYHSFYYTTPEIIWFDKNDPSWARREAGR